MLKPWEKRLNAAFIVFCILLLLFVCIVNIPLPFSQVYDAMEYNVADESHAVSRTVTFDGVYNVNLFSPDTFSGMITVSDHPYANGEFPMEDIEIKAGRAKMLQNMILYAPDGEPCDAEDMLHFGKIYTNTFHRNYAFILYDENRSYGTDDATFIVTGMKDRAKAVKWIEYIFFGDDT